MVLRVWLPDRPGALGAVASRIGAVRGDVVAIDVLERGGGRAVDELTVTLPDASLVDLLISEVGQVDGVDVEDIRPLHRTELDRAVAALGAAEALCMARDPVTLVETACDQVHRLLDADWAVVMSAVGELVAVSGPAEVSAGWLQAFIAGAGDQGAVDEIAFCELGRGGWLVVSRARLPLRSSERELLARVAAVASHLLEGRRSMRAHEPARDSAQDSAEDSAQDPAQDSARDAAQDSSRAQFRERSTARSQRS